MSRPRVSSHLTWILTLLLACGDQSTAQDVDESKPPQTRDAAPAQGDAASQRDAMRGDDSPSDGDDDDDGDDDENQDERATDDDADRPSDALDATITKNDAAVARGDAGADPRDSAVDPPDDEMTQEVPDGLRQAGVRALFPAAGAVGVCPDAPLRLRFEDPPLLGARGKIELVDLARGAVVASVDLARPSITDTRGGVSFAMVRPAYVEGNDAYFYLPSGSLRRGQRYAVRVGPGALRAGASDVIVTDDALWTFTVGSAGPRDPGRLTVSLDGRGDFCSLQGALDVAPASSTIELGRGVYHGIIYFRGKRDLAIRGVDRKATILAGVNNENMNGGTAKRALIGVDASSGISFANLTIHNRTAQGGSQAEALRMQTCDRCSVRDADILSLQDTLLFSGRIYVKNSYIAGNVDFVWGTGTAYFERCEIKTVGRKGYTVQARNGSNGYGYVFVDSKLTSDRGVTGHFLARVDASVYPASHVAHIDCELGSHIDPAGYQVTGGGGGSVRFWEYGSKDENGRPVDVSRRLPASKQISEAQAAMMRDPSIVFGGWKPE
jgi:hypothetical protein